MPHVIERPGALAGTHTATLLAFAHALNDVLMAVLVVLLPAIQVKFDASATTLAVLVAILTVSSSATQPIIGAFAERLGLRRLLALGLALTSVSMSLIGPADSLWLIMLLLLVGGLGSAALHPVATSVVGNSTVRNPGAAVGLFTAGGMVGFALGPALVLWFVRSYGLQQTWWLMIPGLLVGAFLWWSLPDWEPHTSSGSASAKHLLRALPRLGWLLLTSVLVSLVFIVVTSAVPLWLVHEHGVRTDGPLIGWVLGALGLAAGAGAVLGGVLGQRMGYRRAAIGSLFASIPAFLGLIWLPAGVLTIVAAAVAGALLYVSQPLLVVQAQSLLPEAPAAAAGLVMGFGTGLAGALYVGIGLLQSQAGLTASLILGTALLVPAAGAANRALRVG